MSKSDFSLLTLCFRFLAGLIRETQLYHLEQLSKYLNDKIIIYANIYFNLPLVQF